MIDWLVFSRDRPMQLEACLDSLIEHASAYVRTIGVLYHSTAPEYDQGYGVCRSRYPQAWFVPEVYFPEQVEGWLRQATDRVGFLCDDDIFYRRVPVVPELEPLPFSFRLGRNCTFQHPTGMQQSLPNWLTRYFSNEHLMFCWSWKGAEGDFGYPFALDGHAYDRQDVLSLLGKLEYSDPTTLEASAVSRLVEGAPWPERMGSFSESCLASIPANRVTVNSHNPIMDAPGLDTSSLNYAYIRGQRIDWKQMNWSSVGSAHPEVPYVFA